jgi:hypothetical protein
MTVSSIDSQVNNLQLLRAQSAFRKTLENLEKAKQNEKPEPKEDIKEVIPPNTSSLWNYGVSKKENEADIRKEDAYVTEIKKFINKYNFTEVEEEDIQSALRYGTSLLADYIA